MNDTPLQLALRRLTRPDLGSATFSYVPPASHFPEMHELRLTRLSKFWEMPSGPSIREASEDFVAGMFGHDCSWLYVLVGQGTQLQCWIAADRHALDSASLTALAGSSFPDCRIGHHAFDTEHLSKLKYGLVLSGCPDVAERSQDGQRERLEKLARSLIGTNWLYLVSATPVEPDAIARRVEHVSHQIQETRIAYLLKNSSLGETEHAAQKYIDLLEKNLARLEEAGNSGLWTTRCSFYTDNPALLPRARHALQSAFVGPTSLPQPIRVRPCLPGKKGEPEIEPLTTRELALLTRPMIEDFPGYEVVEYSRFGVEGSPTGHRKGIDLGEIVDRGRATGRRFAIDRDDLTRHALIVGVTGSGKTNTCFNLLDQVWNGGQGVPFLAIESAKSEYRSLMTAERFKGLRVFTVGDETISPLRINPFEVPQGVAVQTHLDYIRSLFAASFVLYPPMPYVLERAMQEVYEDRGWNLADNINRRGVHSQLAFPTLSDLASKVDTVVERMGYDRRVTMDVRAGLRARLDQLRFGGGKGRLLNTRDSVDQDVLFGSPCLLELKNIVDDNEKAFVIGLVLVRLYEYRETKWDGSQSLQHVTLIEEAHRLLRNVSTGPGNEVSANPRGQAIEVFSNILSEIRALGEGIVVSEQIPTKLATDVIKNTGTKILHRLVSQDDRSLVAGTANLDEAQARYLARLAVGEAVAWTNDSTKAVLIEIPRFRAVSRAFVSADVLRSLAQKIAVPCTICGEPHRSCNSRVAETRALRSAFQRVYNAMRLSPSLVGDAIANFLRLFAREWPHDSQDPFCAFVAVARADIDERGAFGAWPHEQVEHILRTVCARARPYLDKGLRGMPLAALNPAPFDVEPMQPDGLPFSGCSICKAPCSYRYDMASADSDCRAKFRVALGDEKCPTAQLAEMALDATVGPFLASDPNSVSGAALCFAVQQCADTALKLSEYHQLVMASLIKDVLEGKSS